MKTVKNFLIDFGLCLLIALPFHFLCDMVAAKWFIDWLDIQLGLVGVSQDTTHVLIRPHKIAPIKPYIRLMNLALSYNAITQ